MDAEDPLLDPDDGSWLAWIRGLGLFRRTLVLAAVEGMYLSAGLFIFARQDLSLALFGVGIASGTSAQIMCRAEATKWVATAGYILVVVAYVALFEILFGGHS